MFIARLKFKTETELKLELLLGGNTWCQNRIKRKEMQTHYFVNSKIQNK